MLHISVSILAITLLAQLLSKNSKITKKRSKADPPSSSVILISFDVESSRGRTISTNACKTLLRAMGSHLSDGVVKKKCYACDFLFTNGCMTYKNK